jgi:hypothetical protein
MTNLTYLLATFLLLWSMFFTKAHLGPGVSYLIRILRDPLDSKAWLGFLPSLGVILVSYYVSVRTFINPSDYWLKATAAMIAISITTTLGMFYVSYRIVKRLSGTTISFGAYLRASFSTQSPSRF